MKTNLIKTITLVLFASATFHGFCQGFQNLNFESANTSGYSPGSGIPTSVALPGWTAYYGVSNDPTAFNASTIHFDNTSLGAVAISLVDTNANSFGPPPIQGTYSVFLQSSIPALANDASVGQTAQIPITTQSLTFFARINGVLGPNLQVSFNGQDIPFNAVGIGANYTIFGADVSGYAGQIGQLLFTVPVYQSATLDNIQFSSSPIPEPTSVALGALGALLFGFRRWRFC